VVRKVGAEVEGVEGEEQRRDEEESNLEGLQGAERSGTQMVHVPQWGLNAVFQ
jgi:hypothetical protein